MTSGRFFFLSIHFAVPVKYEHVVFCGLSDFQLSLYRLFISSPEIKRLLRGQDSQPLKAINILKKLCNHPELLNLPDDLKGSEDLIPEGFRGAGAGGRDGGRNIPVRSDWSGKFIVLDRLVSEDVFFDGTHRVLADSCITSTRKPMTRLCLLATTPKRWICLKNFVGIRST